MTVEPIDTPLPDLGQFEWIAFTSKNGVSAFFRLLDLDGRDARALGNLQVAAIGPGTAEALGRFAIRADLIPESHRSEGLADALAERAGGRRILLARADRGREVLAERLRGRAHVESMAVYRNADAPSLPEGLADRIARGEVDWITLTSPAIARNLHRLLPDPARGQIGRSARLATISPLTSEAARSLGWEVAAEAEPYTWDALIDAIARS
ncbi:MAG: uroporphyrinogen-III synthase [Isosphaeraceae bacterium]